MLGIYLKCFFYQQRIKQNKRDTSGVSQLVYRIQETQTNKGYWFLKKKTKLIHKMNNPSTNP